MDREKWKQAGELFLAAHKANPDEELPDSLTRSIIEFLSSCMTTDEKLDHAMDMLQHYTDRDVRALKEYNNPDHATPNERRRAALEVYGISGKSPTPKGEKARLEERYLFDRYLALIDSKRRFIKDKDGRLGWHVSSQDKLSVVDALMEFNETVLGGYNSRKSVIGKLSREKVRREKAFRESGGKGELYTGVMPSDW